MLEDFAKFLIYGVNPIDSQTIKSKTSFGGWLFMIGNGLKVLGTGINILSTISKKVSRLNQFSFPESIGVLSSISNSLISFIVAILSIKDGRDFVNQVDASSDSVNDLYEWARTKVTDPISYTTFRITDLVLAQNQPNFYNPIPLNGSISKKGFLGLTLISFGLDFLLYFSSSFISR